MAISDAWSSNDARSKSCCLLDIESITVQVCWGGAFFLSSLFLRCINFLLS